MSDLGSEILKKYGTAAVIFGVLAAFIIWLSAHIAAEPGKEVSAIWGLVNYTKRSKVIKTKPDSLNKKISELEEQLASAEKKAQVAEEKAKRIILLEGQLAEERKKSTKAGQKLEKIRVLEAQLTEAEKKAKMADQFAEQNTKLRTQLAESVERAESAENKAREVEKLKAQLTKEREKAIIYSEKEKEISELKYQLGKEKNKSEETIKKFDDMISENQSLLKEKERILSELNKLKIESSGDSSTINLLQSLKVCLYFDYTRNSDALLIKKTLAKFKVEVLMIGMDNNEVEIYSYNHPSHVNRIRFGEESQREAINKMYFLLKNIQELKPQYDSGARSVLRFDCDAAIYFMVSKY